MAPTAQGVSIILHGHSAQFWIAPAPTGVQQASRLSTAEQKAARYDRLTANEGTFEVHDSTVIVHFEHAKNPAAEGSTGRGYFRLVGDTLWETTTSRWARDTTNLVRSTIKYVREK